MGKVAVTFRILPEGVEVDLSAIEVEVRKALGARLKELAVSPVAFGLKAVNAIVVVDDASGEMEQVEGALAGIAGVGGVEATDVTLL